MKRIIRYLGWAVLLILAIPLIVLAGRGTVWLFAAEDRPGLSGPAEVYTWEEPIPEFGGYSSLIMSADGTSLLTASDRGHFISASVSRDALGDIQAVEAFQHTPLLFHNGAPTNQFLADIEGLAPLPDGTIAISFESYTRLQIMDPITPDGMTHPKVTHPWDMFEPQFHNYAFEAITALPTHDQTGHTPILTMMEQSTGPETTDAYIYDGTDWQGPTPFPRSRGFDITGADLGPDGCLYILERHYGVFTGFQFQVSRRHPTDWDTPATLLFRSAALHLGNGEGISVWRRGDQLVATVITDNGIPSLDATKLIELPLAPAPDCVDQ